MAKSSLYSPSKVARTVVLGVWPVALCVSAIVSEGEGMISRPSRAFPVRDIAANRVLYADVSARRVRRGWVGRPRWLRRHMPAAPASASGWDGHAGGGHAGIEGGWAIGEYQNLGGPYGITTIKGQAAYFDAERGWMVR